MSLATAPPGLTDRQREILALVWDYHHVTHEGMPARVIARRLGLHHETVRAHLAALWRKGFIATEQGPAIPVGP